MRNYTELIAEFVGYVTAFYNDKDGIYPIATKKRIKEAVNIYLESKSLSEIYFDSLDREQVRKIIQPSYSLTL